MDRREVVLYWDNFGPYHEDRCEALAKALGPDWTVTGLSISRTSHTYGWQREGRASYNCVTLVNEIPSEDIPFLIRFTRLLKACWERRGAFFFLCHYEQPATLLTAMFLRLLGQNVFVMGDSKFDDYDRSLYREVLKSLFYLPYRGALTASARSRGYLRFLGIPSRRVVSGYNTVSIDRIRRLAEVAPAPDGTAYAERHFTIVARLVPKKNLAMALDAYAVYHARTANPRELHLCGSGPLEAQLVAKAMDLGISDWVRFRGWLQGRDVCVTLGTTLALLLPSSEEQFGIVVIEAQAMGLPVILSENCGARDQLVRTGVNGFVVEPHNAEGMAFFMAMIGSDENLWRRMASEATKTAPLADSPRFAEGVLQLIEMTQGHPTTSQRSDRTS